MINDLKNLQIKYDLKKEYRDLKDFYLDDEKKKKLKSKGRFERFLYQSGYLISSIFQKLTPLRKLLVIIGLVLMFIGNSVHINNQSSSSNNTLFGGLLIFFVLVLELKDKLLAVEELIAGRKIQKALMPEESPNIDGWELFLFTTSANEVSGDLVDYLKINDDRLFIIIADVAGKGLSAALLTTKLQATIRAFADTSSTPAELTERTNKIFNRDSLPNIFASMIFAEISISTGEIRFANAGHLPPIIIKEGRLAELEKGDAALGILQNARYRDFEIKLNPGEVYIAYSDGITEAINEGGEFYGKDRFLNILNADKNLSPAGLGHKILGSVNQFRGQAKISDDVSIVIIKRK